MVDAEDLYAVGMRPERFPSVVRPLRTGLWRLLRPSMLLIARELRVLAERIDAEVRARTELAERADIADARLLDSERRIIELEAAIAGLHGEQHLHDARLAALDARVRDGG